MALADPQSIKISGTTTSLPRTFSEGGSSKYTSEDGLIQMTLTQQQTSAKRKRNQIRVDLRKISADPFIPTQNKEVSMSCYIVFDRPEEGFSNTEALALLTGLDELGDASESKVWKALLGGQS